MGFGQAISSCFSQYVTFSGRASRSEYWYFTLFIILVEIVVQILAALGRLSGSPGMMMAGAGLSILLALFMLAIFLPGLAVIVRRLHDIDRSGWWYLIGLVPLVGVILLLVWFCSRGTNGPNRFGADPLAGM